MCPSVCVSISLCVHQSVCWSVLCSSAHDCPSVYPIILWVRSLKRLLVFQNGKNSRWCDDHFLNYKGLKRAAEIREQLKRLLQRFKVPLVSCEGRQRQQAAVFCVIFHCGFCPMSVGFVPCLQLLSHVCDFCPMSVTFVPMSVTFVPMSVTFVPCLWVLSPVCDLCPMPGTCVPCL